MVTPLLCRACICPAPGRASRRRLSGSGILKEHMGGNSAESTASASRPEWPPGVCSGQSGLNGRHALARFRSTIDNGTDLVNVFGGER